MRQGPDAADLTPEALRARRLAGQLQELAVVRAALSERQLDEVMVDFWTNHFNVFFGKGADRFLLPDYIEHVIRPHALGKFEDLLVATAQSPAMMFYLDNWQSVAPGTSPPLRARPTGINENYARELMELHTLGVDGGYTQADVIAVARILTGWSIARPQRGGAFEYHDWAHDGGMKVVLGDTFPRATAGTKACDCCTCWRTSTPPCTTCRSSCARVSWRTTRPTAASTTRWRPGSARTATSAKCCAPFFTAPISGRRRTSPTK